MKTRKKKTKKIAIKRILKILEILVKIGISILCIYVFFDRLQDVNGIEFFFHNLAIGKKM